MRANLLIAFALTLFCAVQSSVADEKKAPPSAKPSPAPAKDNSTQVKANPLQVKLSPAQVKAITAQTKTDPAELAMKNGERLFKKNYCVGCHADGSNALRPDKPIKGAEFAKKYASDALLEQTIRKGFPDEGMPAFPKDQISESQFKDLILYIRSFTPKK